MQRAGLPVRHLEQGCNVPMYRTRLPCLPAGAFSGPLVVTMRPLTPAQAIEAVVITSRYPRLMARQFILVIRGHRDYGSGTTGFWTRGHDARW